MLIIEFVNDMTGDADVAHYHYRVRMKQQLIAEGQIRDHHRDLGWQQLVRRLLRDEEERSIQTACLCLERVAERLAASLANDQRTQSNNTPKRLAWTIQEVSRATGLSMPFLRKQIVERKLPVARVGRRLLIRDGDLHVYLGEEN